MTTLNTHIKSTITWKLGEKTGIYEDDFGFLCQNVDGSIDDFWWTDGNGACDCNRSKMFMGVEMPCGDTIEIISINPKLK